ncbi:MAG TPA: 16S rRNA (uracil(1498)-N(3))-methyltransferase [Xanthobacteraceae bacterium]|jgi:16S rRNA (uracil1498-N3)-methyltransferase
MPRHDFRTPRLYVDSPLRQGETVTLDAGQANHLIKVLRLKAGEPVLIFNGREGEWRALLTQTGKRTSALSLVSRTREQGAAFDLHYLFAPLKHARLDYMTQKAVEMGASRLQPVITQYTQVSRVNLARIRANAIEAAQQCGVLTLPEIAAPLTLERMIAERGPDRLLVFCDEQADVTDPVAALAALRAGREQTTPIAVLIGPEGGFAPEERQLLAALPNTVRLCLGPRILRADTAAVAALALVGAVLGDWR